MACYWESGVCVLVPLVHRDQEGARCVAAALLLPSLPPQSAFRQVESGEGKRVISPGDCLRTSPWLSDSLDKTVVPPLHPCMWRRLAVADAFTGWRRGRAGDNRVWHDDFGGLCGLRLLDVRVVR